MTVRTDDMSMGQGQGAGPKEAPPGVAKALQAIERIREKMARVEVRVNTLPKSMHEHLRRAFGVKVYAVAALRVAEEDGKPWVASVADRAKAARLAVGTSRYVAAGQTEALLQMMLELDSVDAMGEDSIRTARRAAVREVQALEQRADAVRRYADRTLAACEAILRRAVEVAEESPLAASGSASESASESGAESAAESAAASAAESAAASASASEDEASEADMAGEGETKSSAPAEEEDEDEDEDEEDEDDDDDEEDDEEDDEDENAHMHTDKRARVEEPTLDSIWSHLFGLRPPTRTVHRATPPAAPAATPRKVRAARSKAAPAPPVVPMTARRAPAQDNRQARRPRRAVSPLGGFGRGYGWGFEEPMDYVYDDGVRYVRAPRVVRPARRVVDPFSLIW